LADTTAYTLEQEDGGQNNQLYSTKDFVVRLSSHSNVNEEYCLLAQVTASSGGNPAQFQINVLPY
jgi:hypothetical protein